MRDSSVLERLDSMVIPVFRLSLSALPPPTFESRVGFGLMPHQKHQALVPLKTVDFDVTPLKRGRRPAAYQVTVKPALVLKVVDVFNRTGGLVALEQIMPAIEDKLDLNHIRRQEAPKIFRRLTVALMEELAKALPYLPQYQSLCPKTDPPIDNLPKPPVQRPLEILGHGLTFRPLELPNVLNPPSNSEQSPSPLTDAWQRFSLRSPHQQRQVPPLEPEPPVSQVPKLKLNLPKPPPLSRQPFQLKTAYDKDRRGTNPETRHIHHGHFDPARYTIIGLMDGPFKGITPGKHNRMVIDTNEVQDGQGELPQGFAEFPRYITQDEEDRFGIEFNSHQGSIVIHDRNRFIHWTEGEGGAALENWQSIRPYFQRSKGDQTRTPYGFFGFIAPTKLGFYEEAEESYRAQRSQFIGGR